MLLDLTCAVCFFSGFLFQGQVSGAHSTEGSHWGRGGQESLSLTLKKLLGFSLCIGHILPECTLQARQGLRVGILTPVLTWPAA